MRSKHAFTAILILFLVSVSGLGAADYPPGEIIVRLEHGILDPGTNTETSLNQLDIRHQELASTLTQYSALTAERVFKGFFVTPPFRHITGSGQEVKLEDLSQIYLIRLDTDVDMELLAQKLTEFPGVVYAHPNYYLELETEFPNDFDFQYQWGLYNDYVGETGWDINALRAWSIETGNSNVLVAMLDTGLEPEHFDDDRDEFYGRIHNDEYWHWQPAGQGSTHPISELTDPSGHGTHTTGIAAAAINNEDPLHIGHGSAGVAGGWNGDGVEILFAQMPSGLSFTTSNVAPAFEWAAAEGADALNFSFGWEKPFEPSPSAKTILWDAMEECLRCDVTIFKSAGNTGGYITYPGDYAAYDLCCAVANITKDGEKAGSSSYGSALSFSAPGTNIWSTLNASRGYYGYLTGTSMAAPHATGTCALLHSAAQDEGYTLLDVDAKRIMEKTARDITSYGTGWDEKTGYGCVDAWNALRQFYWPYVIEHRIITRSQLQLEDLGYSQVQFLDDQSCKISAGHYFCDKYKLTGSVSFNNGFEEIPWFWERILDVETGYPASGAGNITTGKYGINVTSLNSSGATFETYTYYVKNDILGNPINEWVPYHKDDIEVAITALGRTDTKDNYSAPYISANYGVESDLAVDVINPDVPNTVHIAYLDRENEDLRYIVDNFDGFQSSEIVDGQGNVGWDCSIALDYEGKPHIAYQDRTEQLPKHAEKQPDGSWDIEPMLPDGYETGIYDTRQMSIEVSYEPGLAEGFVHVCLYLYYANPMPLPFDGKDLVYLCKNGSGPIGWSIEAVDVPGDVGNYCDLALGPDGVPHISYYDATNSSLKYAVRNGSIGPDYWVTTTVDNTGSVGQHTSIAVDKLGGVHISYYDQGNDDLKYAYKAPDGNTWDISTLDNLGEGTSICIDSDGRPVILYGGYNTLLSCTKKMPSGWEGDNLDFNSTAIYRADVGIDNLGRLVATYYKDNKLFVARRMGWDLEPISGYPLMSQDADISEDIETMDPVISSISPNPTSGSATVSYQLSNPTNIRIAVYDVTGRQIKTLVSDERPAGEHQLIWEGTDNSGRSVSSGVYFVKMQAGEYQSKKKVTLLR